MIPDVTPEGDAPRANGRPVQPSYTGSPSGRRQRGKLKIFLGYAPGVGKTYAMLDAAHQRLAEGVDVVVAWIRTHARLETEEFLRGIEIVPPALIQADGPVAADMALDAVLARRPALALVDDLSHANVPGARHPKRYLDVEELLDAGIDVYSTLDVQQLASLNDVVAQITGVTVADTVPDRLLDEADEIELVDVPPAELIRRLREGKVDIPPAALGAVEDFYRPGNLAALRELALRRAADRVDRQMRSYMHAREISGPWAAGERLLICLSPDPLAERLVRTGRRLAAALSAEWFAVFVETPAHARLSEAERDRLASSMRLAEALGARTLVLPGRRVVDTVLLYARQNNITKIVAGKPRRAPWLGLLRPAVADELIQRSGDIDVYVINSAFKPARGRVHHPEVLGYPTHSTWAGYLLSAALVTVTTVLGHLAIDVIQPINFVILYLLPVIISAVRWGLGPSVLASVLSVLAFDFFFVSPKLTFAVYDMQYLLTFAGLLLVSLVVSTLAAGEREQAEAASRRALFTATLYDMSRDLAAALGLDAIMRIVLGHVSRVFGREVAVLMPEAKNRRLAARAVTPGFVLDAAGQAAATWTYEHGQPAGAGTETHIATAGRYLPLKAARGVIGVLAIDAPESSAPLSPEQVRLLEAFASQAALGIERAQLAEQARDAYLHEATEKLQTALLNSVSHDLRTPLASITGALTALLDQEADVDAAARRSLAETARGEAERLNHLVGNLLDMTRVDAGAIQPGDEPIDVADLVGASLAQLGDRLEDRPVRIDVPDDLPAVPLDFVLMTQVLVNLLDNAVKYSPAGSPIDLRARAVGELVEIAVSDRGSGIPAEDLEHIFDKFYRVQRPGQVTGTGLGLAISRGIVEAHCGQIWAANRPGGGATVTVALPLAGAARPTGQQAGNGAAGYPVAGSGNGRPLPPVPAAGHV